MRSDVKLFIVKPERSSWEDAYQIVKHMRQKGYSKGFKLLINMAKNQQMADLTAKNFVLTCEKSLKVEVQYLGYLLQDEKVADAIRSGEIFLAKFPESSSSLLFQVAFHGFEIPQEVLRVRNVSYLEALFTNSG
jgi:flagellar biosynthesis protein FlhG